MGASVSVHGFLLARRPIVTGYIRSMVSNFRNVAYGSSSLGLEGIQFRSSRIFNIIHTPVCQDPLPECDSLDSAVNKMAASLQELVVNPPSTNPVR